MPFVLKAAPHAADTYPMPTLTPAPDYARWAEQLTAAQVQALASWIGNGIRINSHLRHDGYMLDDVREQLERITETAVAIEPGTVLWRGQPIPARVRSWREKAMLCTSESREIAQGFGDLRRRSHGRRGGEFREPFVLRIEAGENLLGVPLLATAMSKHIKRRPLRSAFAMDCAEAEREIILLPCELRVTSIRPDAIHVTASDSRSPLPAF